MSARCRVLRREGVPKRVPGDGVTTLSFLSLIDFVPGSPGRLDDDDFIVRNVSIVNALDDVFPFQRDRSTRSSQQEHQDDDQAAHHDRTPFFENETAWGPNPHAAVLNSG